MCEEGKRGEKMRGWLMSWQGREMCCVGGQLIYEWEAEEGKRKWWISPKPRRESRRKEEEEEWRAQR